VKVGIFRMMVTTKNLIDTPFARFIERCANCKSTDSWRIVE